MRKFVIIILTCCLPILRGFGQELTFFSAEVEEGVRKHLNLTESVPISFTQLDTITSLDLSHSGITDLRDLTMMPNLRLLDLSENMLDDLQPLALLDSLEWVDLRHNNLKGINQLFYSTSKKLTIDVAFNRIRDFTLFGTFSTCSFTLEGTGLQLSENAPILEIYQFYSDVDNGEPVICYRGFTNLETEFALDCGTLHQTATMDGGTYRVMLSDSYGMTVMATLSNEINCDTTWVVTPRVYNIRANQEVTFDTELPETYTIGYANANVGTVEVEGTKLRYIAPETESNDMIYFTYYKDNRVKGFSQLTMSNPEDTGLRDNVVDNAYFELHGNRLSVRLPSVKVGEKVDVKVVDAIGRQLVNYQSVAMTSPYFEEFVLPEETGRMIIVQVSSDKVRYIKKLLNTNNY